MMETQDMAGLPVVGQWYQLYPDPPFEVVAVDADMGTIEVQYFGGTIQEFEFDTWSSQPFINIAAPEDVSGALDMDNGMYGDYMEDGGGHLWDNPIDQMDIYSDSTQYY